MPPKNKDVQKLLLKLEQSKFATAITHEPEIRLQLPELRKLAPNPRTSEPASFLSLPRELRHRILFHSATCDWVSLLNGDMFKHGKAHPSYFKWLPECFLEWEWVMSQVDYAGRLDKDVDFVTETWWRALHEAAEEQEARELSDDMGGLGIARRSSLPGGR